MSLSKVIEATRDAIDADVANGQVSFTTENDLVGVTEVQVKAGPHGFTVDEPAPLGGGGVAPNPVEYALASLGSCQAITYRFWAEKLGIAFDEITVKVDGDLDLRGFFGFDDSIRAGFRGVRIAVKVSGPESEETYRRLAASVDEHCPVLDIFSNPVPVERQLDIS